MTIDRTMDDDLLREKDRYPPVVRVPLRERDARYVGGSPVHPVSIDDMPAIRLLTLADSRYTVDDARGAHDLLTTLAAEIRKRQSQGRISLADDRSGDHVWEGARLEFKTPGEDLRQWSGVPDRIVFDNGPAAGGLTTLELMLSRTRKRSRKPRAWLRIDAPADDLRLPRRGDSIQERMDKAAATLELFAGIAARIQIGEETLDPDALRIALATPHAAWRGREPDWVKVMSSSDIADGYAHDWWDREWHAATAEPQPSLSFSTACTFRDQDGRPREVHLMVEPRAHFVYLRNIDEDTRRKVAALPSRAACP